MAQRRGRSKKKSGVSPVASMLFGLAVGLSVAAAVYMKDRRGDVAAPARPEPASLQSALDENGEAPAADEPARKDEEPRFTFYNLLPNFEVVTQDADEEPVESAKAPQAVVVYVIVYKIYIGHQFPFSIINCYLFTSKAFI